MVFSTSTFLFLFLPGTVILYYLLSKLCPKCTNLFLFAASILFYSWNAAQYTVLLLFSVFLNYTAAILLSLSGKKTVRRILLVFSLAVNIGLLCYYKYSDFLLLNLSRLFHADYTERAVVLPIGISFYTFQAMSYVIDVYRGTEPLRSPVDLGMYITFFPQLIAGPIVRFGQIRDYIYNRRVTASDFYDGLTRFLTGLCKKVILANNLGALADVVFNSESVGGFSVIMLWLSAVAYSLQIYYDFSGYSDMAIGLGRIFGFHLPENFRYPYAAATVTDFWRRWHISLSSWFRDYVYIPLGGSRKGTVRHILNLLTVWVLTGLWHGAAWQYLIWGLFYFLLLTAEKYLIRPDCLRTAATSSLYRIATLIFVCLLWVVFRAGSLPDAAHMIASMFGFGSNSFADASSLFYMREYAFYTITGLIFMFPIYPLLREKFPLYCERLYSVFLLLGTLLSVSFILKDSYNPFLYFQF